MAEDVFAEMKSSGMLLDTFEYNCMMLAYQVHGHWKKACDLYTKMQVR